MNVLFAIHVVVGAIKMKLKLSTVWSCKLKKLLALSPMSPFIPNNYQQFLLVCGWCKNNTNSNIPTEICDLFSKFHNTNICMVFQGQHLTHLLSQISSSEFLSKLITYQNMTFQCKIMLDTTIRFSIHIISKPSDVKVRNSHCTLDLFRPEVPPPKRVP